MRSRGSGDIEGLCRRMLRGGGGIGIRGLCCCGSCGKGLVVSGCVGLVGVLRCWTYDCHHGYSEMAALKGGVETPPYMTIRS